MCVVGLNNHSFRIKAARLNPSEIKNFKKQRNYVVKLDRKVKLAHFNSFRSSKASEPFGVKYKPYFSKKNKSEADTDIILTLSRRRSISYRNQSIDLQSKSMLLLINEYFRSTLESLDLHFVDRTEGSKDLPAYASDNNVD